MYDFQRTQLPINALVLHVNFTELSRMKGEWERAIEFSSDDITTLEITKIKYVIVVVDTFIRGIFSVRQWVLDVAPRGTGVARFSRYTEELGTMNNRIFSETTIVNNFENGYIEECFTIDSKTKRTAPESKLLSIDLEEGAQAIARYYGLARSQISISMRDSQKS